MNGWELAGDVITGLVVVSTLYLGMRGLAWAVEWRRRRPRRARVEPFVARLERVRRRETRDLARPKGAPYCGECGFPLVKRKATACPFCAVTFEVAS